jgi:hypothetical protein
LPYFDYNVGYLNNKNKHKAEATPFELYELAVKKFAIFDPESQAGKYGKWGLFTFFFYKLCIKKVHPPPTSPTAFYAISN